MTKQLRKRQKELKENVDTLSNQKVLFKNLKVLLDAKMKVERVNEPMSSRSRNQSAANPNNRQTNSDVMSFD